MLTLIEQLANVAKLLSMEITPEQVAHRSLRADRRGSVSLTNPQVLVDVPHAPIVERQTSTIADTQVGGGAAMTGVRHGITRLKRRIKFLDLSAQAGFSRLWAIASKDAGPANAKLWKKRPCSNFSSLPLSGMRLQRSQRSPSLA